MVAPTTFNLIMFPVNIQWLFIITCLLFLHFKAILLRVICSNVYSLDFAYRETIRGARCVYMLRSKPFLDSGDQLVGYGTFPSFLPLICLIKLLWIQMDPVVIKTCMHSWAWISVFYSFTFCLNSQNVVRAFSTYVLLLNE